MSSDTAVRNTSGVILLTSCGQRIESPQSVARVSGLIRTMLEDIKDGEDTVVPLPNVDAPTLRILLDFMRLLDSMGEEGRNELAMRIDDTFPVIGAFPAWARDFEVPGEMLSDVFVASSYMDVTPLEKLVLAKIVAKMREMTPEDMRADVVEVKRPFSEDEELKIRDENAGVIDGKPVA